ncbi:hypothetical protein JCM11491_005871 [Sporobolomyces phaffii]
MDTDAASFSPNGGSLAAASSGFDRFVDRFLKCLIRPRRLDFEEVLPTTEPSFESLPPELVHHIVASSIPRSFHSSTYLERQATLSSLCLVSKRLSDIAQPRLSEILWIKSADRKNLERLFQGLASTTSRSRVEEMVLNDNWSDILELPEFARFLEDCPRLRSLRIYRWSGITMNVPSTSPFRIVKVDNRARLDLLHCSIKPEAIRQLVISRVLVDQLRRSDVQTSIRSERNLRYLTLCFERRRGTLDLSVLTALPFLESLQLSSRHTTCFARASCILLHLTNLSITGDMLDNAQSLLNPNALPSLRILALTIPGRAAGHRSVYTTAFIDLLRQIDTIVLDVKYFSAIINAPRLPPDVSHRLLVCCDSTEPVLFAAALDATRHLRLTVNIFSSPMVEFADWFEADSARCPILETVYLDACLLELAPGRPQQPPVFRKIAQPLLSTIVMLGDEMRGGFSGGPRYKGDVRELVVVAESSADGLQHHIRSFTGLRKLSLILGQRDLLDLSGINGLFQLVSFQLTTDWKDNVLFRPSTAFLHLQTLVLKTFGGRLNLQLLDPVVLPSFKTLAVLHNFPEPEDDAERIRQSRLFELLQQLDVVIFSSEFYAIVEEDLPATGTLDRILVDTCFVMFNVALTRSLVRTRHVRIAASSFSSSEEWITRTLRTISTTLQVSPPPQVRLLYLPSMEGVTARAPGFSELREVCERMRVELVVEAENSVLDPVWSWNFCRHWRGWRSASDH